ncbi:MAG: Pr6Pr family membrane protein [Hyphomicrobiaceae bacterium]|nr:Pr6Pr family membrane protein [Hyphomicrobiaceae bacterium]
MNREPEIKRTLALFGFAFGSFALIAQGIMSVNNYLGEGMSFLGALVRYLSFLTILTNASIVLIFLAGIRPSARWLRPFRAPFARATTAAVITLVAVYYHLVLAADNHEVGVGKVNDILFHYVQPALYLIWFFAFARSSSLRYPQALTMLVPPMVYLAWVLARGAVTGMYPYDVVDAGKFGYLTVAKGVGMLIAAGFILNLFYIAVDRTAKSTQTRTA